MIRTFDFDIDGYPDQSFRIVLDSKTYEVRFRWNARDESWLFDLGDVGTTPTISMKLTAFSDLLAPYRYKENVPQGNLFLIALRNISDRPGRYNIGVLSQIQMVYASHPEDVETID